MEPEVKIKTLLFVKSESRDVGVKKGGNRQGEVQSHVMSCLEP